MKTLFGQFVIIHFSTNMVQYQQLKQKGSDSVIDAAKAQLIAQKYYKDVFAYCYSLTNCNKYEAEVLTQDVFLLFQEKCNELDDELILRWLFVVAKNKAKEYYREKQKAYSVISLDNPLLEVEDIDFKLLFEDHLPDNDEETQKYVEILIKALTPKERELYRKIYIEKKSHKEIADEWNLKENTVSARSSRLTKKIKAIIKLMFSSVGQFVIGIFF